MGQLTIGHVYLCVCFCVTEKRKIFHPFSVKLQIVVFFGVLKFCFFFFFTSQKTFLVEFRYLFVCASVCVCCVCVCVCVCVLCVCVCCVVVSCLPTCNCCHGAN